jgi:hypothetical protein
LVEKNDAMPRWIVKSAHGGIATAAGAAMYDKHWLAKRITAFLNVDFVLFVNFQT